MMKKRIELLQLLQTKITLDSFDYSNNTLQFPVPTTIDTHPPSQFHPLASQTDDSQNLLVSFNEIIKEIQLEIQQKSHDLYELIQIQDLSLPPSSKSLKQQIDEFFEKKLFLLTTEEFLEFVKSFQVRVQSVLHRILQHEGIETIDLILTGGEEGYMGDFMLEYEINPAVAVTTIYWPDVSKFKPEHIDRFTLGNPADVYAVNILGFLTDFSHEIGHVLQNIYKQQTDSNLDDGWLVEHDPSVISMNLLSEALKIKSMGVDDQLQILEDEFSAVPCLLETCLLWLSQRTHRYHSHESVTQTHFKDYHQWKSSCGYDIPSTVNSASVAADYLKIRAALESYPINLEDQLHELFVKRSECNLRDEGRQPSINFCHTWNAYPLSLENGPQEDGREEVEG
jgi:hypothetical protein